MRTERNTLLLGLAAGIALSFATPVTASADDDDAVRVSVSVASSLSLRLGDRISNVAVGASEIADVAAFEPDHLLVTGRRPGTTTATVWTSEGIVLYIIDVEFPLDDMRAALRKALPDGKKLDVASAGSAVLLSGTVSNVEDVERAERIVAGIASGVLGTADVSIVNMMSVDGNQQVQLEVSFAEVSRSSLREIGFNFWSKKVYSNSGYAGGILAPTSSLGGLAPSTNDPGVNSLNAGATGFDATTGEPLSDVVPLVGKPLAGTFGFVFGSTLGGFPFSAALSLLANRGYARSLAEPTLVAMSGKSASFLAGGEFPVPIPSSLGNSTIDFRKFGIQLEFTPTVFGDDVELDLSVTVSDIDFSLGVKLEDTAVPGLTTRHSQTTVRLKDGQSFVIAGLLSDRVRSNVDKVPWLGDIPVIGALFKSSSYRREETELLVVVTAHLVKPLDERPELPGENTTTDPSDLELFLFNEHESMPTLGAAKAKKVKRAKSARTHNTPAGAVGFRR